ncbi:hypothetical protein SAMD00019534_041640 [Acytostelium subglobosum LB1]|uniref:hypothetical protein n=1 Tax=Acytostelium subglobosum LB1 TaxID=1410327 RepID=UPI000644B338|nr:hypothetical protein SAMD00019534_041640 [Acytostelium subglobosum LB1]GAM20989.1 hypothetical protein SAMD00019534_041640 [Acytostelium subglobosum LB1]|eukprot:XP_012756123.1 hypothetical protein SAMD00019534_041640 [Acytostelium subglobosum LB1]
MSTTPSPSPSPSPATAAATAASEDSKQTLTFQVGGSGSEATLEVATGFQKGLGQIQARGIWVLLAFWAIMMLISITKTIFTIRQERSLKKLRLVTGLMVTFSSICFFLLFFLRINGSQYVLLPLDKLGFLFILYTYLLILFFWINSLLVGDPRLRVVKYPKFFIIAVVVLFLVEMVDCMFQSVAAYDPRRFSAMSYFKESLFYSSYKSMITFTLCCSFSSVGYLIYEKAKKLSAKNVYRFKRVGFTIGTSFLFVDGVQYHV